MINPWENISLASYETHMELPEVGQAEMLACAFSEFINTSSIKSIALIGCAGGNGLSDLKFQDFDRLLCLDVNQTYIHSLRSRYSNDFPGLECQCVEIESFKTDDPVDFIFAGLVLEYTRLEEAINSIAHLTKSGGLCYSKNERIPTVSNSPYMDELSVLNNLFRYVDLDGFLERSGQLGFRLLNKHEHVVKSGKSFLHVLFKKDSC